MTEDNEHFVFRSDGVRISLPTLALSERRTGTATLTQLIESTASQQLHLSLSCLGVLSFEASPDAYRFVALTVLRASPDFSALGDVGLRRMSFAEALRSSLSSDHEAQLELARRRYLAELSGERLGPLIRRALDSSIGFLSRHVSRENGYQGWSQYFDDRTVGSLSTAQGVLAHLHAGRRPNLVEGAVQTIEAFQNPDGGWPVRRALVGEQPTQLSITESTCFCLWALREVGRAASDPVVERGLDWLERVQLPDGSWRSSPRAGGSNIPATAAAVRALAALGRTESVDKAAYTAHAILALLGARSADCRIPPAPGDPTSPRLDCMRSGHCTMPSSRLPRSCAPAPGTSRPSRWLAIATRSEMSCGGRSYGSLPTGTPKRDARSHAEAGCRQYGCPR